MIETWQSRTKSPTSERRNKKLGWLIGALSIDLVLILLVLSIEPSMLILRQTFGLVDVKLPTLSEAGRGVMLFDRSDHYLCTLHDAQDRRPVPLAGVSINMRNALLAAEDRHFYNHGGIDPDGVARALKCNYQAGHVVQGGSTITQQLVRNLFLDKNDRSWKRKIQEAFLAWDVDHRYSKAKILETYLNVVYFGGGVYGVERAAQHYFNKHADSLTVPESAFLAGLIKAPSILGAPQNLKLALEREQTVIKKMAEYGFISEALAQKAKSSVLVFKPGAQMVPYPYYIGYAMQELRRKLGSDLWSHGWKVYTNLDVAAQKSAESTLNKGIRTAPHGIDQGALVTMSVKDGAVLALVGGVGKYDNNPWNRALFPHTAGSSFKPFVYLAALADGIIKPDTMIDDVPLVVDSGDNSPKYTPRNFDGKFLGWTTVRTALAFSRNVCSARLALQTGMNRVIEVAHGAGIKAQLDPFPSLALGACAVSPLDMTTAYATLARGGVYIQPQVLRAIQSDDGKINISCESSPSANLPAEAVAQLVDIMQDVVRYGTGTRARLPGIAVAGKSGTADDARDIWFIGFTPDTVTGVWGGNDKNLAVAGKNVTGGTVMAVIWHDYMMSFYRMHKFPSQLAFSTPAEKLIEEAPHYNAATLVASVDPNEAQSDAEKFSSKLAAGGIARAADLEKASSSVKQQTLMLAQAMASRREAENPNMGFPGVGAASVQLDTGEIPAHDLSNIQVQPVPALSVRDMLDADNKNSQENFSASTNHTESNESRGTQN